MQCYQFKVGFIASIVIVFVRIRIPTSSVLYLSPCHTVVGPIDIACSKKFWIIVVFCKVIISCRIVNTLLVYSGLSVDFFKLSFPRHDRWYAYVHFKYLFSKSLRILSPRHTGVMFGLLDLSSLCW